MTTKPNPVFARRIKEARERKGWTRLKLAYEAGVSQSSVQRWEQGRPPRMRKLLEVLELLDIPLTDIIPTEDRPAAPSDPAGKLLAELAVIRAGLEALRADLVRRAELADLFESVARELRQEHRE